MLPNDSRVHNLAPPAPAGGSGRPVLPAPAIAGKQTCDRGGLDGTDRQSLARPPAVASAELLGTAQIPRRSPAWVLWAAQPRGGPEGDPNRDLTRETWVGPRGALRQSPTADVQGGEKRGEDFRLQRSRHPGAVIVGHAATPTCLHTSGGALHQWSPIGY